MKNARELRRSCTSGEDFFWRLLRGRRFEGIKFRRQHPWPPYTLDFFAPSINLAIELDGDPHAERRESDAYRDATLARAGITTLRFTTDDTINNLEGVLMKIWEHARERMH
ncbi:MAG: endonuclease domain-containing protein [Myxococcaceae bacterium]